MECVPGEPVELDRDEAVRVVAASARKLFPLVSERQAREMAALVLRDLEGCGMALVRRGS